MEIISFSLLWSKSAERSILFACENECTRFHKKGSRGQRPFVRSRVKPRPVDVFACDISYWVYFLSLSQFHGFENGTRGSQLFNKIL